jgi:hydrogenase 3 maturation protease
MVTKPTSTPGWLAQLKQISRQIKPADAPLRLAVVGIGQPLRGDDAAGVLVAQRLLPLAAALAEREDAGLALLVIDAGPAPENQTGSLRRFRPHLVLLVDAAQMEAAPGTIRWLALPEIDGLSASTHTLPLHLLARYLTAELNCQVALIGIQPATTALMAGVSTAVDQAVADVCHGLMAHEIRIRSVPLET